jgi:hypothetical protein
MNQAFVELPLDFFFLGCVRGVNFSSRVWHSLTEPLEQLNYTSTKKSSWKWHRSASTGEHERFLGLLSSNARTQKLLPESLSFLWFSIFRLLENPKSPARSRIGAARRVNLPRRATRDAAADARRASSSTVGTRARVPPPPRTPAPLTSPVPVASMGNKVVLVR